MHHSLNGRLSPAALLLATAAVAPQSFADPEQRVLELDPFTRVVFNGSGQLELAQSGEHRATLTAEPEVLERVEVRVSGDTLHIRRKGDGGWSWWSSDDGGDLLVAVELDEIEGVTIAGSGDGAADALAAGAFELAVSGSGGMEIGELVTERAEIAISGSGDVVVADLQTALLEAAIVGSGDMQLQGRAEKLDASISGSGDLDAGGLESQRAELTILGSGDMNVWAVQTLDGSVTGSGDIRYRGQPQVDRSVTGSGEIERYRE